MNAKQNSTPARAGATEILCSVPAADIDKIGDNIEKTGGMIAKASASKHLTQLLLGETDRLLRMDRGQPGITDGVRSYQISDGAMDTLVWLISEIWETSRDLSEMVDALQEDMVPLANAAYEVLKAGRAAA